MTTLGDLLYERARTTHGALPPLLLERLTIRNVGVHVLTLRQPFASLIACGRKTIETRPKGSRRNLMALAGDVFAVNAGLGKPLPCEAKYLEALARAAAFAPIAIDQVSTMLPRGEIVAVAVAGAHFDYVPSAHADLACAWLDDEGRGGLELREIAPLARPIPWKGALGLGQRIDPARLVAAIDWKP